MTVVAPEVKESIPPEKNPKEEFDKDAIVARYGKDGMTYFTGQFTQSGEGIFSKCPNKE
jgi:hypothetical protein